MGPTGSGKSNLINHLGGYGEMRYERKLRTETGSFTPYPIYRNGLRIVLVDTPGFDDTYRSDIEVLRVFSDLLTQKRSDGTALKVCGIIYCHRITDNRMSGSVFKNLQIFGRICGSMALRRTHIVTTMWDTARDQRSAQQREKEFKTGFWKKLLDEGAVCERFHNTPASAWAIVQDILAMGNDGDELLLQEELINQQKRFNETEAAKVIYSRLRRNLVDQKKTLKELADEASLQKDPALVKALQEEYEKINMLFQKTAEEMKELEIPLSRRIFLSSSVRKSRGKVLLNYYPEV